MMNLTRWEPFREFEKLPDQMARLFGFPTIRPYGTEEALTVADFIPTVDIYETEKEIVLKMELPEMRKEDVQVTLEDNVLTLRGERRFQEAVNRENYHRIERKYGEFMRIFTLRRFVESSRVLAEFKEGMLTVTLPKNQAAVPKQIDVKVM